MAKELPYFQFEPAEYLTKDVSFCSLEAQGLFINICSYYWQRECKLSKSQLLKRLNYPDILDELVSEGIIDFNGEDLVIKFLDNQYLKATKKSQVNSKNGAKGGRPKKQKETEIKPNENPIKSESKGIREDKIIKDEIIKKNIIERKAEFKNSLHPFLEIYSKDLLNDFYSYWTEHGEKDKKMRFEKQTSFSIERRLATWKKNEAKFGSKETESFTDFGNKLLEKYKA